MSVVIPITVCVVGAIIFSCPSELPELLKVRQVDVIPDSSLNFSRPSPSTPNGNDELSDDDILPPSPNPPR